MKTAAQNTAAWIGFAAIIAVVIGVSVIFQSISDAGQEVGGIVGFLAEWFFG